VVLAVFAVLFLIAFTLVIRFYSVEGGSRVLGGVGPSSQSGLLVTVDPDAVDATREISRVLLNFEVTGQRFADRDGRLVDNVRVTLESQNGYKEILFPRGTVVGQDQVDIGLDGQVANYPFDQHSGTLNVLADTYRQDSDGSFVSTGSLLVGVQPAATQDDQGQVAVGVNGWDTTMVLSTGMDQQATVDLTFDRAFSTQIFAVLILSVAGMLALLALSAGTLVYTGRRPAEAALLSWTAALLFALPALRNYLPNSPPLGAAIDMYAYLWFMVAAGIAAVLMILGWSLQRAQERRHLRERAEGDAHAA
jgi:hypothetical protein